MGSDLSGGAAAAAAACSEVLVSMYATKTALVGCWFSHKKTNGGEVLVNNMVALYVVCRMHIKNNLAKQTVDQPRLKE